MEKKTFASRIELKFAAPDGATTATKSFTGYGAYFDNKDSYGDTIAKGAFAASLARHKAAGTMPLMLLNHDAWGQIPIGVWKSMSEDENGLVVEGELIDTTTGNDVYTALKAGAISGLSIGFRCVGFEMSGNIRNITEADLLEVSVVTFPANDLARVEDVKSQADDDEMLKASLLKAGFAEEAVTALFDTRNSDEEASEDESEKASDEEESDEEPPDDDEAKYDEAGALAALTKSVETIKEMYVR